MAGPGHAHLLDHAKGHAAAAMHRHAGRLVDGKHMIIFKKNGEFTRRRQAADAGAGAVAGNLNRHGLGFLISALRRAHRRQPYYVARFQPSVGLCPALVDAHFAAADDAVHMGFGHALELADQKVVQPLAGVVFAHGHQAGLRAGLGYRFRQGRDNGPDKRHGRCGNRTL